MYIARGVLNFHSKIKIRFNTALKSKTYSEMSIHVYWLGIIGVPGKGPNWTEPYDGNKTLGDITREMKARGLGERNKEIKMFKFKPGNLNVYDKNSPYWTDDTKLDEYARYYGGLKGGRLEMIYVVV